MSDATLGYADQYGIRFHRDFLSDFLSFVIRQGTDKQLVVRLRDLILEAYRVRVNTNSFSCAR